MYILINIREWLQYLRQRLRVEFGRSASTARERRQADFTS